MEAVRKNRRSIELIIYNICLISFLDGHQGLPGQKGEQVNSYLLYSFSSFLFKGLQGLPGVQGEKGAKVNFCTNKIM
jgi:hypothetical protein